MGRPSGAHAALLDSVVPASLPGCTWQHTAFLIIAELIGVGVLAIPGAFRSLGWAFGLLSIFLCYPANLLTGMFLSRMQQKHPTAVTLGDLGQQLFGRLGGITGWAGAYFYLVLLLGNFAHVMALSLQVTFWAYDISLEVALCFSGCVLILPAQVRVLTQSLVLCVFSAVTILVALVVCTTRLATHGCLSPDVAPADSTIWPILLAISAVLFAFAGQNIFLEIIAEMARPLEFGKALQVSFVCLVLFYTSFASVVYGICGQGTPAYVLDAMPLDWSRSVAGALVFCHTLVSYTINHQVLGRAIHLQYDPARAMALAPACEGYWAARMQWFIISLILFGLAFAVAAGVPDFSTIIGIICGLLTTPLCFVFPCVCFIRSSAIHGTLSKAWRAVIASFAMAMVLVAGACSVASIRAAVL